MPKVLPANASLEQLKKQAKDLVKSHSKGDRSALATLRLLHRFKDKPDEDILKTELSLQDAQFALAMDYGFSGWNEMRKHVESQREVGAMPDKAQVEIKNVEDLKQLNDGSMQLFLREIDSQDLTLAMSAASRQLQDRVYANVSRRAGNMIRQDLGDMGPVDPKVLASAQKACLDAVERGRQRGVVFSAEAQGPRSAEWERLRKGAKEELAKQLSGAPSSHRSGAELIPLLSSLSREARAEGLLALERIADERIDDDLLKHGLQMVVDGYDPDLVQKTLQDRKATLVLAHERRLSMVMMAVAAIQSGMNPAALEDRCKAFLQ